MAESRAKYHRVRRANLKAQGLPRGDERHGTVNAYTNLMCRCEFCRAAHTQAQRAWRTK